jgi:hypothetical protein
LQVLFIVLKEKEEAAEPLLYRQGISFIGYMARRSR